MKEAVAAILALGFATCLLSCCGSILARLKKESRVAAWRRALGDIREHRNESQPLIRPAPGKELVSYFDRNDS
jgi:hypothetical protein